MKTANVLSSTDEETKGNGSYNADCNDTDNLTCSGSNESLDVSVNVANSQHGKVHASTQMQVPDCPKKRKLQQWLNKNLRIEMTDGRVLVGVFLCTDRDSNIILGSCSEFLNSPGEDARILGLVMIPGRHIVSIKIEASSIETT